jgi:hypothetical protein
MHFGSYSGTGFGTGSKIKCNTEYKSQKIKKCETNCLGNNAASNVEKGKILYKFFDAENCAKYFLDPESELDPEPKPKLFQSRDRNRIKSLRFHNTGIRICNSDINIFVLPCADFRSQIYFIDLSFLCYSCTIFSDRFYQRGPFVLIIAGLFLD